MHALFRSIHDMYVMLSMYKVNKGVVVVVVVVVDDGRQNFPS